MKRWILLFLLVLFVMPLITSVEFTINTEYKQGETLLAKVSGNFIDNIDFENIAFYRGHVKVPFIYDVTKIEDEFYIYSTLPETSNNYSIVIKDVKYMEGSKVVDYDIQRNFTITNDTVDFSIFPGHIITKNDFSLKVQNLQDTKITISVLISAENKEKERGFFASLFGWTSDSSSNETTFELKSGEIQDIDFQANPSNSPKFEFLTFKTENTVYEIPIYILANQTSEEPESDFKFDPGLLNISMPTNTSRIRLIYLQNTGQVDLEDINLSISSEIIPYFSISKKKISLLETGESSEAIEISINSTLEESYFEGNIKAVTSEGFIAFLPINLNFIPNYVPIDDEENGQEGYVPVSIKTCQELNGNICANDEICDGGIEIAKDGNCCIGTCKTESKTSWGKIIGWTIIIIVILLIGWFYKRRYR